MGKADEERLAIGVQKCPCLYDKVVSSFHNKNQNKNAWKAVAKDIGLETSEGYWLRNKRSCKECFHESERLKFWNRCRKSNESILVPL